MRRIIEPGGRWICVSVPFNAGRGLMPPTAPEYNTITVRFSTLQCWSWIDAHIDMSSLVKHLLVSVPFNAGRGLMLPQRAGVTIVV